VGDGSTEFDSVHFVGDYREISERIRIELLPSRKRRSQWNFVRSGRAPYSRRLDD
jgi:hypothetical protein